MYMQNGVILAFSGTDREGLNRSAKDDRRNIENQGSW